MKIDGAATISVCVFCGASQNSSSVYCQAGYEFGAQLGLRQHRLIYGACGVGVMGAVARGAADHDGEILSVVPAFLRDRELDHALPRQELIVTPDLPSRKAAMMSASDAFVALPGGYGTLDELLEVLSLAALGLEHRPIILLNINGFWDPFIAVINDSTSRGFIKSTTSPFTVVDNPATAVHLAEHSTDRLNRVIKS